jgi:hypothetical protein
MSNLYYEYLERECSPDYVHLTIPTDEARNLILRLEYAHAILVDQRGLDFSGARAKERVINLLKEGS